MGQTIIIIPDDLDWKVKVEVDGEPVYSSDTAEQIPLRNYLHEAIERRLQVRNDSFKRKIASK